MNTKEKMEKFKIDFNILFEKEIKSILKEQRNFHNITTELDLSLENFVLNYTQGGKRIRPFIINFFSTQENKITQQLGIAIELFHLAALIHDDIMDDARIRRGVETIHVASQKYAKENEHLGTDIALLLGDIFLTASLAKAARLPQELFEEFRKMIQRTIRGQYLDSFGMNQVLGKNSEKEILARHELKTAWYTFCSPARLGFMSSGIYSKNGLEIISHITRELGLLYQIRDDIIDCIDKNSGKVLFGDILENQTTWVTLYIKEKYPEKMKSILDAKEIKDTSKLEIIFKEIDLITPYEKEYKKCAVMINQISNKYKNIKEKTEQMLELLKI